MDEVRHSRRRAQHRWHMQRGTGVGGQGPRRVVSYYGSELFSKVDQQRPLLLTESGPCVRLPSRSQGLWPSSSSGTLIRIHGVSHLAGGWPISHVREGGKRPSRPFSLVATRHDGSTFLVNVQH